MKAYYKILSAFLKLYTGLFNIAFLLSVNEFISPFFLNIHILLKYSWLTVFQVHSEVVQ